MKKLLYILTFLVFLFPINPINSINPTNSINSIDPINPTNLSSPTNSINLINSVWSQDSETKRDVGPGTVSRNYIIGKGDVLRVFVSRNEQLSSQVVVRPDGNISLPLLQDLQAEGLTVLQLKEEITRKLTEYINNPEVTVIVNEINSYNVSILGKIVRPGIYPITGDTRLVEAISMAGGFIESANKREITVITHEGEKKKKVTVNYEKIASGKDTNQNIILKRGDTIIVNKIKVNKINSFKVSVLGKVANPGVYPITGDTKVLEAISMAGGFTEWAKKRKITVITHRGDKEKKIKINYKKIVSGRDLSQNIILKGGDTIIVP